MLDFVRLLGIWHRVSLNPPVRSCRDAAGKRLRLGNVGIPLADELKTALLQDAQDRYVMVHCRGHQRLDPGKLSNVVGRSRRVPAHRLHDELGLDKGTVSPFMSDPPVLHVVDDTLMERYFAPYTVMTNLGHHQWGLEFEAIELFSRLPRTRICDVVEADDKRLPRDHIIGILTGNAPESGMLVWQRINELVRAHPDVRFCGDVSFPRVLVESLPMLGATMELTSRSEQIRPSVLDAVERLCQAGATVIGIACNTTQFFTADVEGICGRFGAKYISLAAETERFLAEQGVGEFDLFGIPVVTQLDHWSAFHEMKNRYLINAPTPHMAQRIEELAFSVKQHGVDTSAVNRMRDVARSARTGTVVLALTELSLITAGRRHRSSTRYVDTMEILAQALIRDYVADRRACGGGPGNRRVARAPGVLQTPQ